MAFSKSERWQMLHAGLLQFYLRILLAVLPFSWFKKLYAGMARRPMVKRPSEEWVAAVEVSGRFLKTTCLVQALALKRFVQDSTLIIGVDAKKGFEAHAWVEREGRVILGQAQSAQFSPLWVWG